MNQFNRPKTLHEVFDKNTAILIHQTVERLCATGGPVYSGLADEKQHYYDSCKVIEHKTGGIFGFGQSSVYYIEDADGNTKPVDNYLIEGSGYFNYNSETARIKGRQRILDYQEEVTRFILGHNSELLEILSQINPFSDLSAPQLLELKDAEIKIIQLKEKLEKECAAYAEEKSRYRPSFHYLGDFEYKRDILEQRAKKREIIRFILERMTFNYPVDVEKEVDRYTDISRLFPLFTYATTSSLFAE
ncbi:hypothetical protein XMG59_002335 [Marinobacterium sp. xm-g-59]|uniref:hypothetical protein n=1 Tax=Marinobacterium sp. xm-g-59 TaxID=2497748 RepID=UPI001569CFC1|nr:hypothetical protein [Marinobacterium sp. xm-g-59]NRP96216.1 hypothetical protein [Marinobacterium sp. xm-g-59]